MNSAAGAAAVRPLLRTANRDHPVTPWCVGQKCTMPECPDPASHKVEEAAPDRVRSYSAYLCCEHFQLIMGPLARLGCTGW